VTVAAEVLQKVLLINFGHKRNGEGFGVGRSSNHMSTLRRGNHQAHCGLIIGMVCMGLQLLAWSCAR
jgi:hypothetical protein